MTWFLFSKPKETDYANHPSQPQFSNCPLAALLGPVLLGWLREQPVALVLPVSQHSTALLLVRTQIWSIGDLTIYGLPSMPLTSWTCTKHVCLFLCVRKPWVHTDIAHFNPPNFRAHSMQGGTWEPGCLIERKWCIFHHCTSCPGGSLALSTPLHSLSLGFGPLVWKRREGQRKAKLNSRVG